MLLASARNCLAARPSIKGKVSNWAEINSIHSVSNLCNASWEATSTTLLRLDPGVDGGWFLGPWCADELLVAQQAQEGQPRDYTLCNSIGARPMPWTWLRSCLSGWMRDMAPTSGAMVW
jgi:hypothetical protein